MLVVKNSGKVLEYASRVSNCKQCEMNSSTNIQNAHGCRMNWGGSAKAMEVDLAVELLNRSKNENSRVSQLICDDNATTIVKILKHVPFDVTK